ncbi:MAG: hypothetical protein IKA02_03145, partial [Clostridia bacterium]|nr:hypothetical protein [Clostridia bacterium]
GKTCEYYNLIQQSVVYCASDSTDVGFDSEATQNYTLPEEVSKDFSAQEITIIQQGFSLVDGSVSSSTIQVNIPFKSTQVTVSYNDGSPKTVSDGEVFYKSGKYEFKITTIFGKTETVTMYIVEIDENLNFEKYFGASLMNQDDRVFDKTSPICTYAKGVEYNIKIPKYLPNLYGQIFYCENEQALEKEEMTVVTTIDGNSDEYTGTLDKCGIYMFNLTTAKDPTKLSGEMLQYQILAYVVDGNAYNPCVNLDLLTSSIRNCLLKTKVYSVAVPTSSGGNYIFTFNADSKGYQEACDFAFELEHMYIEEVEDGFYYKSIENPVKTKYVSKEQLYTVLNENAIKNVVLQYIDVSENYGIIPQEQVEIKISEGVSKDTRVVLSAEIKESLLTKDEIIVCEEYAFSQVAKFESSAIIAMDDSGNSYGIAYNVQIKNALPKSGTYTIIESNKQGVTTYKIKYLAESDNTAKLTVNVNGEIRTLTQTDNGTTVKGNIEILDGYSLDSQEIITIIDYTQETYKMMHLSEAKQIGFKEGHQYSIKLTNRLGHTIEFEFEPTESTTTENEYQGFTGDLNALSKEFVQATSTDNTTTSSDNTGISTFAWITLSVVVGASLLTALALIIRKKRRI